MLCTKVQFGVREVRKFLKKGKLFDDNFYSLDMLRINLKVSVEDIQSYLNSIKYDLRFQYREMFSVAAYRHNFTVECENGHTFWIGLCPNSEKNTNKFRTVTVEFNPCKVGEELSFASNYQKLLRLSKFPPSVKRFDLAIDIPIDRDRCYLVKDQRTYQEYRNSNLDLTQYLGHRSSGGFVKLYNKAKELGISDYGLTRFEITIDYEYRFFDDVQALMPVVYVFDDYQLDIDITDTDRVLLLACLSNMDYLDMLGRKKRDKVKGILANSTLTLTLDEAKYSDILTQINEYLNV